MGEMANAEIRRQTKFRMYGFMMVKFTIWQSLSKSILAAIFLSDVPRIAISRRSWIFFIAILRK
jgi:hypothetical protein